MREKDKILQNINTGIYKIVEHKGKSPVWKVFADIQESGGSLVDGYVYCRKCMIIYKYNGIRSSNLNKHKCFLNMAENCGTENIQQKFQYETTNSSFDEIGKVEYTKDVNDKHTEEVKNDYVEDTNTDIFENVKIRNPLDFVSSAEESQPYEAPPQKIRKSSTTGITPKVKERNLQQLNSLCEMIKADLHDAPEDLFFVAKWKIMDILREVQSQRLERESFS